MTVMQMAEVEGAPKAVLDLITARASSGTESRGRGPSSDSVRERGDPDAIDRGDAESNWRGSAARNRRGGSEDYAPLVLAAAAARRCSDTELARRAESEA